mmetsp:Transcript_136275/g.236956  ORF Transcript_136275/g.236956 Transcript_136275/m.236956 type:complete len:215 (-) Transcript_136275:553-1197(-)
MGLHRMQAGRASEKTGSRIRKSKHKQANPHSCREPGEALLRTCASRTPVWTSSRWYLSILFQRSSSLFNASADFTIESHQRSIGGSRALPSLSNQAKREATTARRKAAKEPSRIDALLGSSGGQGFGGMCMLTRSMAGLNSSRSMFTSCFRTRSSSFMSAVTPAARSFSALMVMGSPQRTIAADRQRLNCMYTTPMGTRETEKDSSTSVSLMVL